MVYGGFLTLTHSHLHYYWLDFVMVGICWVNIIIINIIITKIINIIIITSLKVRVANNADYYVSRIGKKESPVRPKQLSFIIFNENNTFTSFQLSYFQHKDHKDLSFEWKVRVPNIADYYDSSRISKKENERTLVTLMTMINPILKSSKVSFVIVPKLSMMTHHRLYRRWWWWWYIRWGCRGRWASSVPGFQRGPHPKQKTTKRQITVKKVWFWIYTTRKQKCKVPV